jgi:hypothetical protein
MLEEKQEEVVGFPQVAAPCLGSGGLVGTAVVSRGRPGLPSLKASGAGGGAGRQSLGVTVATLRRHGGCGRTWLAVAGPRAHEVSV